MTEELAEELIDVIASQMNTHHDMGDYCKFCSNHERYEEIVHSENCRGLELIELLKKEIT